jgi:hypothetical protein
MVTQVGLFGMRVQSRGRFVNLNPTDLRGLLMKLTSPAVLAVVMALFASSGCNDPRNAERDRLRAETDAAKAEQARTRAEMELVRAELARTTAELVRARAELDLREGRRPEPEPAAISVEKQFTSLHANYSKNAITLGEWTTLKAKVIEQIPKTVPPSDRRTLGQRLIDLHACYSGNAITLSEWTEAKAKLIAQKPSPAAPATSLDTELGDLQRAYANNSVTLGEWTDAKAAVAKR